jgi:thermitase
MLRRLVTALAFLSLLLAGLAPTVTVNAAPPAPSLWDSPQAIPGELVVGFKTSAQAAAFRGPAGADVPGGQRGLHRLNASLVNVPPGQEEKYAREVASQPGVQFVEPNYIVKADLVPNDPLWSQQYGPSHIQAPSGWDTTTGSASVIVAVLDSGIDASHPEFAGRILPGWDFVDGDATPQDGCGHGTHVTGILAAEGDNAQGIAGIAWKTSIMPVRVLGDTCSGSTADVADALVWAVERGARVINLSLGTPVPSTLLENGTYYAYSHGAAIFAAAGNSGSGFIYYPAAYPWVMAVGATDETDTRASFSNYGAALDLMAPGADILSTTPQGSFYYQIILGVTSTYGTLSGTSMAAPHASGAAALLATQPAFSSPDAIYQALESTALDLGSPGRDDQTGYGLIQIADALSFKPTATPPPTITPLISYAILNSLTCGNLATFDWRDAAAGGFSAALPVFGDDGYATVSLPFTFELGGVDYSTLTVSANGYATFDGLGDVAENFLLPGRAQPDNFVAPFWDDLTASTGGVIYQQTNGSAPHREYVVEWHAVTRFGQLSPLTFELVLFEGSNDVLFQYKTLQGSDADGSSATIGAEYADGYAASQYSYDQAGAVQEGQALLFRPYPTGDTPPSESCATFTRPVDESGGFFESAPWCVDIAANALSGPGTLQIGLLASAPAMPKTFLDLHHYADISLLLNPPVPLQPLPKVDVCYEYTPADVLKAGGYPENLFLASYASGAWTALPTRLDVANGRISATAPHLSTYGVGASPPAELPVTGAPLAPGVLLALLLVIGVPGTIVVLRRKRPVGRQGR